MKGIAADDHATSRGRRWRRLAALAILSTIGLGLAVKFAGRAMPPPGPFSQLTFSRAFLDRDGKLLRLTTAKDGRYRLWTKLDEIAPAVVDATLAKEDHRFRAHFGVDPAALARAARDWGFASISAKSGASTISMQLARLIWRLETRTLSGKFRQIVAAIGLEIRWSKDEILEAYLNLAPYGGNVEGVGAAAWIYFGKPASALTRPEALRLALLPQSPRRSLTLGKSLKVAGGGRERQAAMLLARTLSPSADPNRLVETAFSLSFLPRQALPSRAPHLVERLKARLPAPEAKRSGATWTTLDLDLQSLVERHIERHLEGLRKIGIANAAALLVHRPSGEVRAYVGSANFDDVTIDGQVDGVRAQRSPGSTLKPLLYGVAIDQGLIHPASMMLDVPAGFGVYNPENFDRSFAGPIDATTALVTSRNVPAIELLGRLTPSSFHRALTGAGIALRFAPDRYGLTLAVGGAEVSMEELVTLYAALSGDGRTRPLSFGARPLQGGEASKPLLSKDAAFMVRTMLGDNPRPGERRAPGMSGGRPALDIAWKTGTSFGLRDAWAVGAVGEWVLAVWLGDFKGRPNAALIGRDAAGPLFFGIVDALAAERPGETKAPFDAAPPRAKKVRVCALSGDLPSAACPLTRETWFLPGISPAHVCALHRFVEVRAASGLRPCMTSPGTFASGGVVTKKVFEFWPSDVLKALAQLGVPRNGVPGFEPGCAATAVKFSPNIPYAAGSIQSNDLTILSPRRGLIYPVPVGEGRSADPILLAARAAADSGAIYWFLGETLLGSTRPGETLAWAPRPGTFVVRAVDQKGRSDARDVVVVATR